MKFWPCREYSVHIKRPAADVLNQLSLYTAPGEPDVSLRVIRDKDKHFVGHVRKDGFAVMPIMRWKALSFPCSKAR